MWAPCAGSCSVRPRNSCPVRSSPIRHLSCRAALFLRRDHRLRPGDFGCFVPRNRPGGVDAPGPRAWIRLCTAMFDRLFEAYLRKSAAPKPWIQIDRQPQREHLCKEMSELERAVALWCVNSEGHMRVPVKNAIDKPAEHQPRTALDEHSRTRCIKLPDLVHEAQWLRDLACEKCPDLAGIIGVLVTCGIAIERCLRTVEFDLGKFGRESLLRRGHFPAMESGCDRDPSDAHRFLAERFARCLHRVNRAGNDRLVRRIDIGHADS